MTDNEIIKALECCMYGHKCEGCSYIGKGLCSDKMKKDVLDLINRQQTRIEKLENIEHASEKLIKKQEAEIERLETDKIIAERKEKDARALLKETTKYIKSGAIKEFAERLKSEVAYCDADEMIWFEKNFDNLVKEMTEVQK